MIGKSQFKRDLISKVEFLKTLPDALSFQKSLGAKKIILIYDIHLHKISKVAKWVSRFENACAVNAGENLKSLESLTKTLPIFLNLMKGVSRRDVVIVALGGGSVGDFSGFVASILKRGVRLVHLPTTWLAAADSAHGGKTALNVGETKNQIGTFYAAERVVIARDILNQQGPEHLPSAFGEILKMALIADPARVTQFSKAKINSKLLWDALKSTVANKYKFVKADPFEEKGVRHVLNFGHTLGHAFELSSSLPHGLAVFFGMKFAVSLSSRLGYLKKTDSYKIEKLFSHVTKQLSRSAGYNEPKTLRPSQLRDFILQDKKAESGNQIQFVLLKGIGKPFVASISVDDVVMEAVRLGFAK